MPISFCGLKQIVDGEISTNQHMIFRGDNGTFIDSAGQLTWLSLDPLNYYTFQGGGFCSAPASGFQPFTNFYYTKSGNLINYPSNGCAQFARHPRGSTLNLLFSSTPVANDIAKFLNNKIATYFMVTSFDPTNTTGYLFENGNGNSSVLFGPLNIIGTNPGCGGPSFHFFNVIDTAAYFPGDGTFQGEENVRAAPMNGNLNLYTVIIDRTKPVGSHVQIRLNGANAISQYDVFSGGPGSQKFNVGQTGFVSLMDIDAGQNSCNFNTCVNTTTNPGTIGEFRWYTYIPDVASIEAEIMSFWGI
jgi:hypothetical protein